MIDATLTNDMLPDISRELLTRMLSGRSITAVRVDTCASDCSYHV